MILDIAMHKAICGHLNAAVDFVEAIALAKNSPYLMSTNFDAHVSINPSRTVTAPGLRPWGSAAKPAGKGAQLAIKDRATVAPKSKAKAKRERQKRKLLDAQNAAGKGGKPARGPLLDLPLLQVSDGAKAARASRTSPKGQSGRRQPATPFASASTARGAPSPAPAGTSTSAGFAKGRTRAKTTAVERAQELQFRADWRLLHLQPQLKESSLRARPLVFPKSIGFHVTCLPRDPSLRQLITGLFRVHRNLSCPRAGVAA